MTRLSEITLIGVLVSICFVISGLAQPPKTMSVQVREGQMRSTPSFLGKIIAKATLDLLARSVSVRELSRVAFVGRREPVTIYEPMTLAEYDSRAEDLRIFAGGVEECYRGRFDRAETIFAGLAGRDPAARAYAAKCRSFVEQPPDGWNGVWVITTK